MKKIHNKWIGCTAYFLVCVMLFTTSWEVMASLTSDKLKETGQKIEKLEEQKEAAEEKVGELKNQESILQGDLAGLNQKMSEVSAQITDLEEQIQNKESEINTASKELTAAKETKATQYERMKRRIQFMYEKGNMSMIEILFSSSSMADMLNKAEYVEEINQYDRKMLANYEEICTQITQKEKLLKAEKKELTAMQDSMEEKEQEVGGLIVKTKESISAKQSEIETAKDAVDDFESQIAKMKAYEEELERKKAEEAKRLAAEQKKKAQQGGGGTVTNNASDLALLAAIVECESGGESYEGQLAVASVVVNRVKSASFPNTVSGVIYQSGQFSPVASGRFAIVLARGANASCVQAASAALSGNTNINAMYFCRASSGVPGTVIGNHVFY